jgi:hypothetical protein
LSPGSGWAVAAATAIDGQMLDLDVLAGALSPDNRATAEDRGLEYVEGARARHCRVAVDGATFADLVPAGEVARRHRVWRRGEASWTSGSSATAKSAWSPERSTATPRKSCPTVCRQRSWVKMTATDRDTPVNISPPRT